MPNEGENLSIGTPTDSAAAREAASREADSHEAACERFSLARLTILLVDDDESCLESVQTVLAEDGHAVFTATRGLEAVECARRLRHEHARLDLSILDYHMPDLTGLETFERILAVLPGVPGIFISGEPSLTLERQVVRAGARALVRKPLDLLRIRSLIREVGGGREIN